MYFEVLEEIDIQGIDEINKIAFNEFVYTDNEHRFDLTIKEYDKINELIRAVKQLDNKLK